MTSTCNAFWNQLNLITGLPDLRMITDESPPLEYTAGCTPSLPKDINTFLDSEYKKELMTLDKVIRCGEVSRQTLKGKLKDAIVTSFPDNVREARASIAYIQKKLEILNLTNSGVNRLDPGLHKFSNLKQLKLVGNQISKVNAKYIPEALEILHLNCNDIIINPPALGLLENIVHLGLAYNKITNLSLPNWFPPNLKSLDLAFNDILDQNQTIIDIQEITSLRSLVLAGNPVCLWKGYRSTFVQKLWKLKLLDDVKVEERSAENKKLVKSEDKVSPTDQKSIDGLSSSGEMTCDLPERKSSAATSEKSKDRNPSAKSKHRDTSAKSNTTEITEVPLVDNDKTMLLIDFSSIRDMPAPAVLVADEPGKPPDEYRFGLKILVHGYNSSENGILSQFLQWQEGTMAFSCKFLLKFSVDNKLRDALNHGEGLTIQFIQRRIHYEAKPEPAEEEVPSGKKKPPAAPAKKKKGAAFTEEELAAMYDATIAEEKLLWTRVVPTGLFLEGGISDRVLCQGGWPIELPQDLLDELAEAAAVLAEAALKKKGKAGKGAVAEAPTVLQPEIDINFYMWPDDISDAMVVDLSS